MDLDELRSRDKKARMDRLYNHGTSQSAREVPKASPQSVMAERHRDEIAVQRGRHQQESGALYQAQQQARGTRLQTSHPLDANFERGHARERDELHEKHSRERSAMQRRHLVERDGLRQKAARR
jgi:hypothetical protein